jgi:fermentation-respiration switch protein FrsA (DUF1100 family)
MKTALSLLLILGLGYLALLAFVYFRQDSLIFYPMREILQTPNDIGLNFEDFSVKTGDGVTISGWYIPAYQERGVVLFCHGNAGNISHRLESIRIFHDLGLAVCIFDYRGYGKSEGSATEKGTYLDAEGIWDYITAVKRVPPEKIILFGRSLGSAVAAHLALTHRAGALIIESGFTSIPELGKKFFIFLPIRFLSRYQYATIEKIDRIHIPKLFIHSPGDEIIPYMHGVALFEQAAEPKEFLRITGGHNEGFLLSGETYVRGLNAFISKYF